MDLSSKTVLVIGLGESGLAMTRWCVHEGANCVLADTRLAPPGAETIRREFPDLPIHTGGLPVSLLEGVDLVAVSPGLAPADEPQRTLFEAARRRAIPVLGEIELFACKLNLLSVTLGYTPALIAITGTNGKTTVTELTGLLCERAGLSTRVAGNISPAALDALRKALGEFEHGRPLPQAWVLELSSFQLESTSSLAPQAAAILNITQDHLDWHGNMEAYAAAKARILARADCAVLNRADAAVLAQRGAAPGRVMTFGMDAPTEPESFGVVEDAGVRWLAYADPEESDEPVRRGKKAAPLVATIKRLMPVDALPIRGDHNAANALAALALCHAIGLPLAPLLHGLRSYRGLPHRVQTIATLDGVDYIDDSKGTNVGATVAALQGLGQKIVLIAGGEGKGQDFAPLAEPVARHARAVVLLGRDGPALRRAIESHAKAQGVEIIEVATLETAVLRASQLAKAGDAVLLSPACASLDMFRNYRHRAEVFRTAVQSLSNQRDSAGGGRSTSPDSAEPGPALGGAGRTDERGRFIEGVSLPC
jgi:UDP-N-acetylmuramoylalanine--D-glutamate ligase